ncbi:vWA domain-containing protein [Clostridium septicum]|uniref:VWA-like domain-containing protein n=1 Tax=Clostridium septicum TaxID=1504 RepID=A0A9N7JLR0_CLOSE|nr:VWA-like domain-containing protein [Clostridium septicum]AYE34934.1 hypothetical protein CP523_11205 [Clostridium septicum]MDU1313847.1 VWA-like domain-containing protein [Clostridium septicum]QAS60328.1 hypothetical protein EI377_05995 [Clostridium septicum]UEC20417.1 VWA-like domain-containing protein [Clostridium septicum]USS01526.1 VWA-like domain-containing protein [Clostridium septicum]
MHFNDERDKLLKEAIKFEGKSDVTSEFKRSFFHLIEGIIVEMLEKEDNFFGQFMVKIKRDIRLDITYPLATIPQFDGFKMFFNPLLFLNYDKKEMCALFKHEIYHIMYNHYEEEKKLKNKYTTMAVNLALDISINQFIKDLPMESYKVDRVNREFGLNLKDDKVAEIYAKEIDKVLKSKLNNKIESKNSNIARVIDISKAHDIWSDSSLNKDAIRGMTKKTAISSFKGKIPKDIEKIIISYTEKPEISWQDILKKLIPSLRAGERKTITRRNRRQPERLDLRGVLPNSIPEILVAIDISASISDDEVQKIMIEILEITKMRRNKITIIECDNEIRRVYKIKSRNDIKKRLNNTGATKFSPIFRFIKENNLRNHILIYFTDGVGEKELDTKPINSNIIWVLTGHEELSLNCSYGQVKRISGKVNKSEGGNSGLEMYRELQHDWAR